MDLWRGFIEENAGGTMDTDALEDQAAPNSHIDHF
jgi:hypothetical protein